jgi:hypothetical protein
MNPIRGVVYVRDLLQAADDGLKPTMILNNQLCERLHRSGSVRADLPNLQS